MPTASSLLRIYLAVSMVACGGRNDAALANGSGPTPSAVPQAPSPAAAAPHAAPATRTPSAPTVDVAPARLDAPPKGVTIKLVEVARSLGGDPARTLRYVAEQLGTDAYSGALRGARGTLLAGAGNDIDKALLVRDLLASTIPPADLRFALCGPLPDPQVTPASSEATGDPRFNPPDDRVEQDPKLQDLSRRVNATARALNDLASAEAHALDGLLGEVAVAPPPSAPTAHVWVQWRKGGHWLDLDPSVSDPAPGKRRCEPTRIAPELPDELYHHLSLRIRLEERDTQTLRSRFLLEQAWRVPDLVGTTLTYGHLEPLGLADLSGASLSDPAGMRRYTPVLVVGDQHILGKPFFLPGAKPQGAKPRIESAATGLFGATAGAVANDGGGSPSGGSPSEVVALWFEIDVAAPGGATDKLERPMFDRIGFAARATGSSSSRLAPLDQVDDNYSPLLTVWSIATWVGEKSGASTPGRAALGDPSADSYGARELFNDLRVLFGELGTLHRSYFGMRQVLFDDIGPPERTRVFASSPSVSLLEWSVRAEDPDAGDGRFRMDVVRSVVVPTAATRDRAWASRWASASVWAERVVVNAAAIGSGPAFSLDAPPSVEDVPAVFKQARAKHVPLLLLGPGEEKRLQALQISAEARARLRAHLAEGKKVLVPASAVEVNAKRVVGWWLVDPVAGSIVDEMEDGRHEDGAEYAVEQKDKPTLLATLRRYGKRLQCWLLVYQLATGVSSAIRTHTLPPITPVVNAGKACELKSKRKPGAPKPKGGNGAPPPPPPPPPTGG